MQLRLIAILTLFMGVLFISDDAMAQRKTNYGKRGSKYKGSKSRKVGGRSGGSRGGRFRKHQYVGFNVNALNYYGDLAPASNAASTDISFTRPGFGITYGYRPDPSVALRANLNWGRLKADDFSSDPNDVEGGGYGRYARNLSFRNDIIEFTGGINIYLFPMNNGPSYRPPINAYIFIGGGLFYSNPKGKVPDYDYQLVGVDNNGNPPPGTEKLPEAGKWVALRPLGTEGQNLEGYKERKYKPINFNIPISIGGKLKLGRTGLDLHFEMGYRFVFTDYLDDVSHAYVGLEHFDDPLARIMADKSSEPLSSTGEKRVYEVTQRPFGDEVYFVGSPVWGTDENGESTGIRGSPNANDMYFVTSFRLTYIIPAGNKRVKAGKFR